MTAEEKAEGKRVVSKPAFPHPILRVQDRGETRNNLPLRDVYLVDGGQCLLHHCQCSAGFADQLSELFTRLGVAVERIDDSHGTTTEPREFLPQPELFAGCDEAA